MLSAVRSHDSLANKLGMADDGNEHIEGKIKAAMSYPWQTLQSQAVQYNVVEPGAFITG